MSHAYPDNGTYHMVVSVHDDDGGGDVPELMVTVENVAPTALAGSDQDALEGGAVTLNGDVFDPGVFDTHTYAWSVTSNNGQSIASSQEQDFTFTPEDEGVYTATLTVTDNDGGVGTDEVKIYVSNVAPAITLLQLSKSEVFESESVTITGAYDDPGVNDVQTITVDWGDGSTSEYTGTGGQFPPMMTHQYADDGPFGPNPGNGSASDVHPISIFMHDNDGGSTTGSTSILVKNVAPTATLTQAGPVNEGAEVTLQGFIEDAGIYDWQTVEVHWGDGSSSTESFLPGAFQISHVYADDGLAPSPGATFDYAVSVFVTDDDTGTSDPAGTFITVNNVPPELELNAPAGINESQMATIGGSVSDVGALDTMTLEIDWGDGTEIETHEVNAANFSFTHTHIYLDDNPTGTPDDYYLVTVKVRDDTGEDVAYATQLVKNVNPEVEVAPLDPVAVDLVFPHTGAVSDLGMHLPDPAYPPETHKIEIDWGDGNEPTEIDFADYTADPMFSASHAYTDIGENAVQYFTIQVTVTDDDTGVSAASQGSVSIAVHKPDIDADSNNDGTIDPDNSPSGTDDPDEEDAPGRIGGVNDNDSNGNGIKDMDDIAPVYVTEKDLAEVKLNSATADVPADSDWTLSLEAGAGADFKVWIPGPYGPGGFMDEIVFDGAANVWDVKDPAIPSVVWVEARNPGLTSLSWVLRQNGVEMSRDTIVFTFVQVDLDMDSDNSGPVDRTEEEDKAEMRDPGKILFYNNDDDNGNGVADRADPAPFVDANGVPVDDDDLKPAALTITSNILTELAGYTLELDPSDAIDIWRTQDKQSLPLTYTVGTDTIPATIYVEGFDYGEATLDFIFKTPAGLEIHRDTVQLLVTRIDLKAFRPNTPYFTQVEVPFAQETNPGVGIRRNGDDDEPDGTPDHIDGHVPNENDLVKLEVFNGFPDLHTRLEITRSDGSLNLWRYPSKNEPLAQPLLGDWAWNTAVLEDPVQTSTFYVEWVNMNAATTSATLELSLWDHVHNNKVLSDVVTFRPFTSVVIVLGGESQVPSDPADPNFGHFQLAIDEYRNSYDVHMYDEDAVGASGQGAAYDEVVNAIENRGVTDVAIIGHSHGGGSTYDLAWRLQQNTVAGSGISDITSPFTIPFTSYVDAIYQWSTAAETRRPLMSSFHTNQYQQNTGATGFWLNGAPAGGDDDINRSYLGVVHKTIDDHPVVLDLIHTRLHQKVTK